jgi:hypothetical protein
MDGWMDGTLEWVSVVQLPAFFVEPLVPNMALDLAGKEHNGNL